ncbi:hypothetical protein PENTCL1PPCAC_6175, partial [Pristionchus entomophagus]
LRISSEQRFLDRGLSLDVLLLASLLSGCNGLLGLILESRSLHSTAFDLVARCDSGRCNSGIGHLVHQSLDLSLLHILELLEFSSESEDIGKIVGSDVSHRVETSRSVDGEFSVRFGLLQEGDRLADALPHLLGACQSIASGSGVGDESEGSDGNGESHI